jgi:O-antigen biosynthesis protein WbqP
MFENPVSVKRLFDIFMAVILTAIFCVPILLIACIIKISAGESVLYWSDRVGVNNEIFKMPKFRTMRPDTPAVATHLLKNPSAYLTPVGSFLRIFSLDELPQLWSILKGDMSFVGPRPALYNQDDLIELRTRKNIHTLIPGITGWAQVNGRDELPIPIKVDFDEYYLKNRSFFLDLKILWMTVVKVLKTEGVQH